MRLDQAKAVMPAAPDTWLLPLLIEMPKWGIDSANEQASFVAQIAHESCELTKLQENLDYKAERLVAVWPRRFFIPSVEQPVAAGKRNALEYAHNPQRLAEYVYGARMGNGPEGSGDGWRFRGRSPVQLTGRDNYAAAEKALGAPLVTHPNLALQPAVGVRIACWYWNTNGMDLLDDDEDIRAETIALNGGETGLKQRDAYFRRALAALSG